MTPGMCFFRDHRIALIRRLWGRQHGWKFDDRLQTLTMTTQVAPHLALNENSRQGSLSSLERMRRDAAALSLNYYYYYKKDHLKANGKTIPQY